MKKKILVIEAAALLLGTILLSGISAQTLQPNATQIERDENSQNHITGDYLVLGWGHCGGIGINGDWWDDASGHIIADLTIENGPPYCYPPFLRARWSIWIIDLETGEIKSKRELPRFIDLPNFNGYGYIDNYHIPKGPYGATFRLFGYADNSKQSGTIKSTQIGRNDRGQDFQNNPCLVFGKGICLQILINGKPNKDASGIIRADLNIGNSDGFAPWKGYDLWIYDLKTGEIRSKEELPGEVHLTNFIGFGFIDNCQIPMGWWYCNFKLCGFASNCC